MIEKIINDKLKDANGRYGVLFEDMMTEERTVVIKGQEGDVFETASVIKLWIMSCAYDLFEKGKLDPERKFILSELDMVPEPGFHDYQKDMANGTFTEDMFPESGILNFLHPGLEFTVKDLIALMILISDNTATNMLIDIIGMNVINQHIMDIGATGTALVRKLFDTEAGAEGKENYFSLSDCADYFKMMYEGKLASPEASREMLAMLQNQQNTYKIPFYLRRLPIAHKTGEDSGIENDVGIVFSERPFIMCFASNEADETEAVRLCQDLAKELEEYNG